MADNGFVIKLTPNEKCVCSGNMEKNSEKIARLTEIHGEVYLGIIIRVCFAFIYYNYILSMNLIFTINLL